MNNMENAHSGLQHGKRPSDPSWRGRLPADVAAMLRRARVRAGLSLRGASRAAGGCPSYGYLCNLEHGRRAPSTAVAETLIAVLPLTSAEADTLRKHALPGVGRDYVRYR